MTSENCLTIESLYGCPYFFGKLCGEQANEKLLSAVENNRKFLCFLLFLKFSDTQNGWCLRIAIYHENTGVKIYNCNPKKWILSMHSKMTPILRTNTISLAELARMTMKNN